MSSIRKRAKRSLKSIHYDPAQGPSNNTSSEYYEKLLNDPHINKLIFADGESEYYFNISDLTDLETIATTRHVVKRMLHKPSNKEMAVKFVHIPHNRRSTDEESLKKLKYLVREIQIFRELRNEPNIVRFYGFCLYEGQALICMELMDLSLKELSLKFIENGQKCSEELLCCIIAAVLKALKACKDKTIIYRDVKPDNILLSRNGAIKLCDFGESRILQDSLASTFAGSLSYWPPERFNHEKAKFDVRADIWSIGITLTELVTGSVPYRDRNGSIPKNIILLQNLITNLDTNKTVENSLKDYTEVTKDFVKSCLKKVEERPKYNDLMATKFYNLCNQLELEKVVQVILKKHYYQEVLNINETNVLTDNTQIKDHLKEIIWDLKLTTNFKSPKVNLLDKHPLVEEMDTSEPNSTTTNENSIHIISNIKENLNEIIDTEQ